MTDPPRTDQPADDRADETDPEEIRDAETIADLQKQDPAARGDLEGEPPPELRGNTTAHRGAAAGGDTFDPGRQNPITPGEGRV